MTKAFMSNQDYSSKSAAYFSNPRTEVEPLLPTHASRVLEVGCGNGATLRWLKQAGRCSHTVGLELFDDVANEARHHVDEVFVGNAELLIQSAFNSRTFDLILCLDVLEHMVDPWEFVDHAAKLLTPGGTIVASIPNVRHLSVVLPLLFGGHWRYAPRGILDQTHLRFFTRQSAVALLDRQPLVVNQWLRNIPPPRSKSGMLNIATLGLMKDLVTMQYLVSATRQVSASKGANA